jgi:uncharacterized protein YndB with AHSA1/START domain
VITTTTTDDFRSAKTFTAAPDAVFSARTDIDALTCWWTPAGGGGDAGNTLRFLMGDQEVVMRVEEANRPSLVRWSVLVCEPAPDWVGTSIIFELEPVGTGTELRFHHQGLNASLVDYVDRGAGSPNPPADVERFAAWRADHAGD